MHKALAVIFLLILTSGICRAQTAPIVSRIYIEIDNKYDNTDDLAGIARNLIHIRGGEVFSQEKIIQSLNALKLCGKFGEIDVEESKEGPNAIGLHFKLGPCMHIKDIKIKGAFPLFPERRG